MLNQVKLDNNHHLISYVTCFLLAREVPFCGYLMPGTFWVDVILTVCAKQTDSFYCAGRVRRCPQSTGCAGRLQIAQTPWKSPESMISSVIYSVEAARINLSLFRWFSINSISRWVGTDIYKCILAWGSKSERCACFRAEARDLCLGHHWPTRQITYDS